MQMSLQSATPCVRIFPATMALAKNFVGYAAFGRLIGDASQESRQLLRDLDIKEVCAAAQIVHGEMHDLPGICYQHDDIVTATCIAP